MSPTPVGREDLVTWLQKVVRGESSVESMRSWMNALIIGESVKLSEREAAVVMCVVYPLESTTSHPEFMAVAETALAVLTQVEPDEHARALLLLAWESDRLIDVLDKQLAGVITQRGFESFLRQRRWPAEVVHSIATLDTEGRSRLLSALRRKDYFTVGCMFLGAGSGEVEARRLVDRQEVERILGAVANGQMSHEELLAWTTAVLTAEKFYVGETEDNDLIWQVIYGLEECSDPGREGEVIGCAARYHRALQATSEASSTEALLWLAGGQPRVVEQLRAYLGGSMSRKDYELSIRERAPAWPPSLIQSMLGLPDSELRLLVAALKGDNYGEVLHILHL